CSIGVSTVHKYLKRAEAAGVSWPLPEDWDEARVNAAVFPRREPSITEKNPARTLPDFAAIHEQLRSSKYVTYNCYGRNTGREIRKVIVTRASANCTSVGVRSSTWVCARSE